LCALDAILLPCFWVMTPEDSVRCFLSETEFFEEDRIALLCVLKDQPSKTRYREIVVSLCDRLLEVRHEPFYRTRVLACAVTRGIEWIERQSDQPTSNLSGMTSRRLRLRSSSIREVFIGTQTFLNSCIEGC
jgi:uncharacterized Fe-S cluster-containing protein